MKIGFIGSGNMATAIMSGIIKNKVFLPEEIIASALTEKSRTRVKKTLEINTTDSNVKVAENSEIIVLAVKPHLYESVIREIRDAVSEDKIIISIAPGKTLAWLEEQFAKGNSELKQGIQYSERRDRNLKGNSERHTDEYSEKLIGNNQVKIIRTMPNTPAMVLEGMTGVCYNNSVTESELKYVCDILRGFGKVELVNEKLMDVVVSTSGSSPAYVFMFIEAMADAAVLDGMPRAKAYTFAAQAVMGSAKMVLELGKHPGELKDMVCSPGGTTIEAVRVLEEKGMRSAVMEAMKACHDKSEKM